jgi:hypothetical protein
MSMLLLTLPLRVDESMVTVVVAIVDNKIKQTDSDGGSRS